MELSDGPDARYWQELAQGRLVLPRCEACGTWQWPAVDRCGTCASEAIAWIERPMEATVFSWTRTWHRFALTEDLDLPYVTVVATVRDCGIRLLGRFEDDRPDDPVIGEAIAGRATATQVLDRAIPAIVWTRAR